VQPALFESGCVPARPSRSTAKYTRQLTAEALSRFYQTVVIVPVILAPVLPLAEPDALKNQINEKDLHVVAAASAINTSFLLTLDKGLEIEVNQTNLNFPATSPGGFIKNILPKHVDFPTWNK
jgi:hypothetical protein